VASVYDTYDVVGRPTQYRQNYWVNNTWSPNFSVTRSYNKAGGIATQTYPSGRTVTYNYDAAGRPGDYGGQPAVSGNLGDSVTRTYDSELRYHEMGGMEQERFGTDTPIYNKGFYNGRNQLAEIRVSTYSILSAGNETNWNRGAIINHYSNSGWGASGGGSDNNGDLRKQEVYIPNDDAISGYFNVVQYYGYDSLNRLTSVEDKPFMSPDGSSSNLDTEDMAGIYAQWDDVASGAATYGTSGGTSQGNDGVAISVTNPGVCSIELRISGTTSPGNALTFIDASQTLGPVEIPMGWFFKVEIRGSVKGDAARWHLGQKVTETFEGGISFDPRMREHYTIAPETKPEKKDDPDIRGFNLQKPKGQSSFYALDSPGLRRGADPRVSAVFTQSFYTYVQRGRQLCGFTWTLQTVITNNQAFHAVMPGKSYTKPR
jgi:hypothetical protein